MTELWTLTTVSDNAGIVTSVHTAYEDAMSVLSEEFPEWDADPRHPYLITYHGRFDGPLHLDPPTPTSDERLIP